MKARHPLKMASYTGKTVLVTGATGFLGGALVKYLIAEGAQVKALVRRPNRDRDIKDLPNLTQVTGDITHPQTLDRAVKGCDVVFHVAVSYGNLAEQTQVNVDGTRNIAEACARVGVSRLVHISSLAAYGYGVRGIITEETPLSPSNEPYSITKTRAEEALQSVSASTGLSFAIVRPGGIYGAGSGLWTRTMFTVARRKPLIFLGDGSGNAPLVHVDDLIRLIVLCGQHPQANGQAFNAVTPTPHTWREFLGEYAKLVHNTSWLGIPVLPLRAIAGVIAFLAPKPSSLATLPTVLDYGTSKVQFSTQKAQRLLGWQAELTLQEGVARCVPYLQAEGLLPLT